MRKGVTAEASHTIAIDLHLKWYQVIRADIGYVAAQVADPKTVLQHLQENRHRKNKISKLHLPKMGTFTEINGTVTMATKPITFKKLVPSIRFRSRV